MPSIVRAASQHCCYRHRHGARNGRARLSALHQAALARTSERSSSAQAVLHAIDRTRALPAPSIALKQGTLHAGRNAGGT